MSATIGAQGSSFPAPRVPCHPLPVALHGACVGRTGASERLALAVKLARRDLQRSLLARGALQYSVQSLPEVQVQVPAESDEATSEAAVIRKRPPSKTGDTPCQSATEPAAESAEDDIATQPAGAGEGEGGGGADRKETSDLVQLKMALAKQVLRLQELCAREQEGEGGEEEEEEEREREKAAEQVSLMARKLYDLHRQVSGVQGAAVRGGQKTNARLAAARRAATRTLHSFSPSSRSCLPSGLLDLLTQLCGDSQSRQLLTLAQMHSDILRSARELTIENRGSRPQSKDQRHKTRKHCSRAKGTLSSTSSSSKKQLKRERKKTGKVQGTKEQFIDKRRPDSPITPLPQTNSTQPQDAPSPPVHPASSHSELPSAHPEPTPPPQLAPPQSSHLLPDPTPHPTYSQSSHSADFTLSPPLNSPPPQCPSVLLSRPSLPHLVSMTTTINTIEVVEEMILRKWQQTPSTPNPPTRVEGEGEGVQLKQSPWHYQHRPTHSQQWREMERLADLLLEEVVSDVCSELEEASDSLAGQLYCREFHEASLI